MLFLIPDKVYYINSWHSKQLIRDEVRKDDLVICYQTDTREILGFTRLVSDGKEEVREPATTTVSILRLHKKHGSPRTTIYSRPPRDGLLAEVLCQRQPRHCLSGRAKRPCGDSHGNSEDLSRSKRKTLRGLVCAVGFTALAVSDVLAARGRALAA